MILADLIPKKNFFLNNNLIMNNKKLTHKRAISTAIEKNSFKHLKSLKEKDLPITKKLTIKIDLTSLKNNKNIKNNNESQYIRLLNE